MRFHVLVKNQNNEFVILVILKSFLFFKTFYTFVAGVNTINATLFQIASLQLLGRQQDLFTQLYQLTDS